MIAFVEVAPDVYVLRHPVLDVNATLVVGDGRALVVDTLSTEAQAAELLDQVRRVTSAPLFAVNTHHHFDHCFGNAALAAIGTPIWAHSEAVAALRDTGARQRSHWYDEWAPTRPELAEALAAVTITVPERVVSSGITLDVGGRPVLLRHLGRGHTAGDLVVLIPDADAVLTGDLIEEGAAPRFEDGYPIEWPEAVAALVPVLSPATTVVPGHGDVVDAAFVAQQHAELTALAWGIREGHADGASIETVADALAGAGHYDRATTLVAAQRGYAELDGRI